MNSEMNYENQNRERKTNKILIFFLFIISIALAVALTYNFTKKENQELKDNISIKDNKAEENDNNFEEKIQEPKKNVNYTFKKSTSNTIQLNGKEINILTYYYVDYEKIYIPGSIGDGDMFYVLRSEIFINNHQISDPFTIYKNSDEATLNQYLSNQKDISHEISYLKDTKNNDKYMIIPIDEYHVNPGVNSTRIYLVNTEGNVLFSFIGKGAGTTLSNVSVDEDKTKERKTTYKDGKYLLYTDDCHYELQDDKLYYIEISMQSEYYDEYLITIENGNFHHGIIWSHSHKNIGISGQS